MSRPPGRSPRFWLRGVSDNAHRSDGEHFNILLAHAQLHEAQRGAAAAGGGWRATTALVVRNFKGGVEISRREWKQLIYLRQCIYQWRELCCLPPQPACPPPVLAAQSNWGSARQKAFQASVPTMYIAAVARKMREKLPVFSSTKPHTAGHGQGAGGQWWGVRLLSRTQRLSAALRLPSPDRQRQQQQQPTARPPTQPPTRHAQDARQAAKGVAQAKEAARVARRNVAHVGNKASLACGRRRRQRPAAAVESCSTTRRHAQQGHKTCQQAGHLVASCVTHISMQQAPCRPSPTPPTHPTR